MTTTRQDVSICYSMEGGTLTVFEMLPVEHSPPISVTFDSEVGFAAMSETVQAHLRIRFDELRRKAGTGR